MVQASMVIRDSEKHHVISDISTLCHIYPKGTDSNLRLL